MKFAPSVLLEIVEIVRDGLSRGADISEKLRQIEVVEDPQDPEKLALAPGYIVSRSIEARG